MAIFTAIFDNGYFWHRHALWGQTRIQANNHAFCQAKFHATVARDVANCYRLEVLGWNVIVIWECALS
jgi:DNA mismatch endonuclease, patch repair protein